MYCGVEWWWMQLSTICLLCRRQWPWWVVSSEKQQQMNTAWADKDIDAALLGLQISGFSPLSAWEKYKTTLPMATSCNMWQIWVHSFPPEDFGYAIWPSTCQILWIYFKEWSVIKPVNSWSTIKHRLLKTIHLVQCYQNVWCSIVTFRILSQHLLSNQTKLQEVSNTWLL